MKRVYLLLLSSLLFCFSSFSQEKKALLIAINKYSPPEGAEVKGKSRTFFPDLEGCVNDGRSLYSLIISRFQFAPKNIDTLFNEAASRVNMEKSMNQLLQKCDKGDIAFIYYAGHGSQVVNSLSPEPDKKDESIVPADAWKEGVKDFRDKELAVIFNKFIDKGVKLTVITDCCHSGSLSRGPVDNNKSRYIADADYDAKDPSTPAPPETRPEGTFLLLAAAQDNESAKEQADENRLPHGAFTLALVKALEQQSVNASIANLFNSIRAILKSNGKRQEPVLAGSSSRRQGTLFGIEKGTLPDKSLVPIRGIEADKIILQGGFALGLQVENELVKFRNGDTLAKLVIEEVNSINRSTARMIKGNIQDLKAGELLEVTNWVSSDAPLLKIYIPSNGADYAGIMKLSSINNELRSSGKVKWINNLEKQDPYTTLYFNGKSYKINVDGKEQNAPANISASSVLSFCKPDSSFYFEMPVPTELLSSLKQRIKQNKSIIIVDDPSEAHYIVFGTTDNNGNLAYGLRRAQTSARDSLESMPVQTKLFSLSGNSLSENEAVSSQLYEYAMRLSKIRGWLNLTPPLDNTAKFPYRLQMRNKETNTELTTPAYKLGDKISFHLVADGEFTGAERFPKRYIYVFMIDKEGNMLLGYPDAGEGNMNNQFPKYDHNRELVTDITLFEGEVSEPAGTDNYFLLASDEPITNYDIVFNQEGVRGNPATGNPLGNLLNLGNEGGTRGFSKSASNWNLIRLAVKSNRN